MNAFGVLTTYQSGSYFAFRAPEMEALEGIGRLFSRKLQSRTLGAAAFLVLNVGAAMFATGFPSEIATSSMFRRNISVQLK